MKIQLDTLSLVVFDRNNIEHINFFKKIALDATIKNRFTGFLSNLNAKSDSIIGKAFFLEANNELIGFIDIGSFSEEEEAIYLRGAIDKEKRGKNYGHKMLEETSNYIFLNYPEVKNIKLKIAHDNTSSIKTAESCGFINTLNDCYQKGNPYYFKNITK